MLDARIAAELVVNDPKPDDDGRWRDDQAKKRRKGSDRAMELRADRHRHVDDIAARQELAQAEQFGEFIPRHPPAVLDDHASCKRQNAAEPHEAKVEEADEKSSDGWAFPLRQGGGCKWRHGIHGKTISGGDAGFVTGNEPSGSLFGSI